MGKKVDLTDIEAALNRFLSEENHMVLAFEKGPDGVGHRVFKEGVASLSLFNPSFSVNGALFLRRIFSKGTKLLLLLRPCEIRAVGELVKLTQIEKESIIPVSVDCFGALSSKDAEGDSVPEDWKEMEAFLASSGRLRPACADCRERRGSVGSAGIRVGSEGGIWVSAYDSAGEEFLSLFPQEAADMPAAMAVQENPAKEKLQTTLEAFQKDMSKCILCMNCRDMCPVCYCIDCVFNGEDYLPKGDALLNKIYRAGPSSLPQGKELFHFIRMFHVSQVCVGCGACEEACPQGLPLTRYFKGISERLQALFGYKAGRTPNEPIPYLTFLEDELKDAAD